MTKQDFLDWKAHPVTKAVFVSIGDRIASLKETLAGDVMSDDPKAAPQTVGAIKAFEFLMNIDYEDADGN